MIVNILEEYLDEMEKRRLKAETEYRRKEMVRHEASGGANARNAAKKHEGTVAAKVEMASSSQENMSMEETSSVEDTASASGMDGDGDATEGDVDETASATSNSKTRQRVRASVEEGKDAPAVSSETVDHDGDISMESEEGMENAMPRFASVNLPTSTPHPASHSTRRSTVVDSSSTVASPTPTTTSSGQLRVQYREEDILLSLQLLAYLSKYPHVRSVFHSPAGAYHPDPLRSASTESHDHADCGTECVIESSPRRSASTSDAPTQPARELSTSSSVPSSSSSIRKRSSNIFALVETFARRPPSADRFTPRHSNELQYWAGVIMRNVCRKDDSRGGIRQCASTECGIWETYTREFAKCRRCRKAKYCSKECQSKAWSAGHRYWCCKNPKEVEETGSSSRSAIAAAAAAANAASTSTGGPSSSTPPTSTSAVIRRIRQRQSGLHSHPSPPGSTSTSRPSTASSVDEDDDDDMDDNSSGSGSARTSRTTMGENGTRRLSGATPVPRRLAHRLSHVTLPTVHPPHHRHIPTQRDIGVGNGIGINLDTIGMGIGVAEGMDENEVAQEMMQGSVVFGDGGGEGM